MSEFFAVLAVTSAPFAVAGAWYRYVRARTPGSLAVAGAMIVAATVQAGVGLVLGVAGLLTPWVVIVAHMAITSVALVAAMRARPDGFEPERVGAVQAAAAAILLAVGGGIAWLVLVQPASNFDSLAYHLPMLAHWVQSEGLGDLPHLGIHRHYAYGFEVWSLPLAVVTRSDVASALPNVAGWTLLALGVGALTREAGVSSAIAVAAAVVVAMAPVTLGRLDAVQPDLWTGAVFVVASASVVHGLRSGERSSAVIAVLAAGLLPFLKASGWLYAAILLLGAAGLFGVERQRKRLVQLARGRSMVVAVIVASALAAFWYVRNLVWTGNPLGDFAVRVAGITVFDGVIPASELRRTSVAGVFRLAEVGDWITLRFMIVTMSGWPLIAWAGSGLLIATTRVATRKPRSLPLLLVLLLVLCVVAYVHLPYGGDNGDRGYRLTPWSAAAMRYAMPAWALVGVLGAVGCAQRKWGTMVALSTAVVAAVLGCTQILGLRTVDAIALLGSALIVAAAARRIPRVPLALIAPIAVVAIAVATVLARPAREGAWDELYGPFFSEVERLVPDGEPVAYYVLTRPYPLVGKRMQHPLTSRPDPWADRELMRADPALWSREVETWLDQLRAEGVRHLVVLSYNRFADRDGRGAAAHALLQQSARWTLQIAPVAPMHLALWVADEDDPTGPSSP